MSASASAIPKSPIALTLRRTLSLLLLWAASILLPSPLDQAATLLALGLLPGLALAGLVYPETSTLTRTAIGFTVSPLLVTLAASALLALGLPLTGVARALALLSGIAWVASPRAASPDRAGPAVPSDRFVAVVGALLAIAVLVPPLANHYILVRGDAFTHAGVTNMILERGLPPEDPYFAGLPLSASWFYNFFLAVLCAFRGDDVFRFMPLFNAATGFSMVALSAAIASALWRRKNAGRGAALLVTLGFNAGAWLLWPLALLRAMRGEVRGPDEVARLLRTIEPQSARIIYSLGAPFAHMVNFLDKLLVGTALSYGYLLLMLSLFGLLEGLRAGRARGFAVVALASLGMMLFHGVVGLSFVPVTIAAMAALLIARVRWPWLPSSRRLVLVAAAAALGALPSLPYVAMVSSGWQVEGVAAGPRIPTFLPQMIWTIATSSAVVIALALGPLRQAWRERAGEPLALAAIALVMTGFASVVGLPIHNEVKFAFEVFIPFALLAGASVFGWVERVRARGALAVAAAAVFFALTPLLTLHGFTVDPSGRVEPQVHLAPAERALYDWMRRETPADAVIVDRDEWNRVIAYAHRQLLLGGEAGSQFGFPVEEFRIRREVLRAVEAGQAPPLEPLRRLERPAFVVYRPARPAPARVLPGLQPVYDHSGYRVYRLEAAK